jgi:diguanylate cyclase (GGDEF)-like protein/PAS domain S-box-containing protein
VGAIFVVAILVSGLFLMAAIEVGYRNVLFSRQNELVSVIAGNIDEEIERSRDYLTRLSYLVPSERLNDLNYIQNFLSNLPSTQFYPDSIFDRGLFAFDRDGNLVAEYPAITSQHGSNFSDREFFRETARNRKSHLSKPFLGDREPRHPVVLLSVPLIGRDGVLKGVLAGGIDLAGKNVLQKFLRVKNGKTGYFYLYDRDRTILLHPDPSRILQRDVAPGANHLFDAGIEGFEGTMDVLNSRGLPVIATVKRIPSSDWLLAANFPKKEAYAPIRSAWTVFLILMIASISLVVFLTNYFVRRELLPLSLMRERIHSHGMKFLDADPLPVPDALEFRELSLAYNQMLQELRHWVGELQESERFIQKITNTVPDILYIFDMQLMRMTYFNAKAMDFTGFIREEMNSASTELPRSLIHPLDLPAYFEHLERVRKLSDTDVAIVKYRLRDHRNDWHWVLARDAVFQRNASGGVKLVIGACTEITQQVRFEEELREKNRELEDANEALARLAITDGLTRLYNHRFIMDSLRVEVDRARRYGTRLSVIMLDIDFFKQVNDRRGHAAGDRILAAVADAIRMTLRNIDIAGRYGGEEFLVLLPQTDLPGGRIVAERIRESVENLEPEGHSERVTVSAGVAAFRGQTMEKLVEEADANLYVAKRAGRNRVEFGEGL